MTPMMLASCGGSSDNAYSDDLKVVDYVPVRVDSNSDWSMVGPDGEFLFEDAFDSDAVVSAVVNGVFTVSEKDKVTVYTAEKSPKVVGDLEDLKAAGVLMDGVIPVVRPQERITLCDKNGKVITTLEPVSGKEITGVESMAHNGRIGFETEDNKKGYLDTKGEVVIAPTYDGAGSFTDAGYAIVYKNTDDKTQAFIIDKSGEIMLKLKQNQYVQSMCGKRVMVSDDDNRMAIVNFDGESVKLPSKYTSVSNWNNDYIVVYSDNGWGVVRNNEEFEVVIKPRYENTIQLLPGGRFMVQKDDDTLVLDKEGERIYTFEELNANYLDDKWHCWVMDGNEGYFSDIDGKRIGKNEFAYANGNPSVSGNYISSDYFNVDAFVSDIAEQITADAIGGYQLGSNSADYLRGENPEDYTWSYSPRDGHTKDGYRFNITTNFISVGTLANWRYNDPYSYYDYSRTYEWSNTPVESANLNATAYTSGLWKKIKPQLIKALESKGFTVTSDDADSITMTGDKTTLYITNSDSYGTTNIYINMTDSAADAAVEVVDAVEVI